jgi:hypothetical protein
LLKGYEVIVIGDREFRSVELASWLKKKKVCFALRIKQDAFVRRPGKTYQKLSEIGLAPGMKLFWSGINYTKETGFGKFSLAAYWKRKYRRKAATEGWYILTNLSQIEEVIKVYQARFGIEALFKDCKTGGYNLSGSKASIERLTRLVLLIAHPLPPPMIIIIENRSAQKFVLNKPVNKLIFLRTQVDKN